MRSRKTPPRLAMAMLVIVALGTWAVAETMTIQTRQATVRSKPSALGKKIGNLAEGDVVNTSAKKGSYFQVKPAQAGKPSGWVHKSALTNKELKADTAVSARVAANSKEATLASRGLNEKVEGRYRASKPKLEQAFKTLDAMNKRSIATDEQVLKFFADGGVEPKEGK
jgi:hypothetical protein